ncbi:MAG: hypothetical protein A2W52_04540 [Candidatus Taylorbacteria bacterium RIFCSPHIGHO2_02_49_25]|uniref:Uncharacterized protein n=1 Tax=Candidatus Taylorbacteria bacterium RIFCSPHIGHO2_02_49_25 TaxID=1802305 RepID=A0A1G2MC45_9BACT|nr:MAG: hypothetical protein UY62_C0023G0002 [Parcubacteria group bacterium GW2011_GWF2_50_9]OHA21284.1 MAG: hypothetical protein A2W52_04540 [Candidatus Taylorbacteria bacterium RIFCSPHIGHO2_02_49_25]OHA21477.1 MAG: hypothetical protein A2759_02465 [Candidatus Taylorbacteria bacterium RIFCSPHIGHO2_01_FULL_49_60]OHA36425.1 MAG: hypothetical protein A2W65_02530 [Candidatus Taylorbacteria bacterium RIFCSPLOWO2_02_50_13]HCB35302.1 hypothetical protein [Candidatus Taylorbacteria bacterium]
MDLRRIWTEEGLILSDQFDVYAYATFLAKVYHAGDAVYNAETAHLLDMRKYIVYIWIGVWLLLLSFLGIPGNWKETLLIITAFGIIAYSYVGYRKIIQARVADSTDEGVPAGDATADSQSKPS